ncbi:MAG: hypothetical protein L6U16_10470 [Porphyromonadaceae bacterium]|nr:MAG: hypothetical protein L6U16_10470 [Porphyromonadaceae bacterium]
MLPFVYLPSVDELKVDTAKLDSPNAPYLRSKKIISKITLLPQMTDILDGTKHTIEEVQGILSEILTTIL